MSAAEYTVAYTCGHLTEYHRTQESIRAGLAWCGICGKYVGLIVLRTDGHAAVLPAPEEEQ